MRRPLLAMALLPLVATSAFAAHTFIQRPQKKGGAAPPLRIVVVDHGAPLANCVFADTPIAELAPVTQGGTSELTEGQHLFGRCFFPDRAGPLKRLELVDRIAIDDVLVWTQAYEQPPAASARSRLIGYDEILRSVLPTLKRGRHTVRVDGWVKNRHLYTGSFRYVRP